MNELNLFSITSSLKDSTHNFILRNAKGSSRRIGDVNLYLGSDSERSTDQNNSEVIFNHDRKYYSPTFIHFSQKNHLEENDSKHKKVFQKQMQETLNDKVLLFIPKPDTSFCYVCKESFPDYRKHIDHPFHKKNIASSPFENDICDLIDLVRKKRGYFDEADPQIQGFPSKKRKYNQDFKELEIQKKCSKVLRVEKNQFFNNKFQR